MNPNIIKRIILTELFPTTSLSHQQDIDLNWPLRNGLFWRNPRGIKRFSKLERIFDLPPIPYRLDYNKSFFHHTPNEILDYINYIRPQYPTQKQIADNLILIEMEIKILSIKQNGHFINAIHINELNKECQKHKQYLDSF